MNFQRLSSFLKKLVRTAKQALQGRPQDYRTFGAIFRFSSYKIIHPNSKHTFDFQIKVAAEVFILRICVCSCTLAPMLMRTLLYECCFIQTMQSKRNGKKLRCNYIPYFLFVILKQICCKFSNQDTANVSIPNTFQVLLGGSDVKLMDRYNYLLHSLLFCSKNRIEFSLELPKNAIF